MKKYLLAFLLLLLSFHAFCFQKGEEYIRQRITGNIFHFPDRVVITFVNEPNDWTEAAEIYFKNVYYPFEKFHCSEYRFLSYFNKI